MRNHATTGRQMALLLIAISMVGSIAAFTVTTAIGLVAAAQGLGATIVGLAAMLALLVWLPHAQGPVQPTRSSIR